jgi:ElaB/YqjD/DUF883 family membrane-anchored ribosome-binding protein
MSTAIAEPKTQPVDLPGRAADAVRHAAHFAHEARLLKSLAADALDDAVHASKQTVKSMKRRMQDVADRRHDLVHQVRREPLQAIGIAFGIGALLGGVAVGVVRLGTAAYRQSTER